MADTEDQEFDEAFKGFGEDKSPSPVTPPAESTKEEPKPPETTEEPKPDETTPPVETPKPKETTSPADDEEKTKEGAESSNTPEETPAATEEPKSITKDDLKSLLSEVRTEERTSSQVLEETTKEVLEAYYPDGLSNVLRDTNGKELRTPQDVVDASNGEMSMEEAAQWLMNEQYKLDKEVASIKDDAKKVAETTLNFKRDSIAALQKYEPLFKAYPALQQKTFDKLMKQVKTDKEKGVILSAPDVMEHYDDYLEPYQMAYEHQTKQSATNPVAPPETASAPKPSTDDRLDEGGDGGTTAPNDPNDFAQQVNKELAKEF